MEFAYSDIIGLGRPAHDGDAFSRRHPKMAQLNRAKIFAPFAALAGYDEAVRSKQVPYVPRRQRDAGQMRALNRALATLERATRTGALARRNRVEARGGILRGLPGSQPRGLRPGGAVPRPHRRGVEGGPGWKGVGRRRKDPALCRHLRHHIAD